MSIVAYTDSNPYETASKPRLRRGDGRTAGAAEVSLLENRTLLAAPDINGTTANQLVNDNATINPFASVTVTDGDTDDMFARVTIANGSVRGDFTAGSTTGWTRTVIGNDIRYEQYYPVQANIGSVVQADLQAFVFDPRTDAIAPGSIETTAFTLYVTDGTASDTDTTTTVVSTSVNNAPLLTGALANQAVNDNATIAPFTTLQVTDTDTQDMFARVTINNGVVRGDLTAASTAGWTRTVNGNNIVYTRYFNPTADIGTSVEASIQALVFDPRTDEIAPGTTESTSFTVYVTDGISSTTNTQTSVTTSSVNNAVALAGAVANQAVNDSATIAPFSTLTVTDPDTQDLFTKVTVVNGVNRGDFTAASTTSWTRVVVGNDIVYQRYYSPADNIGATVQADIRAFVFDPRTDAIAPGTTETTAFTAYVTDGITATTNTQASVVTTSVENAPTIGGTVANQPVNDNSSIAAFSTLTVSDSDTQDMFASVRIVNGVNRGDFTLASSSGWTRTVVGSDIVYARYFASGTNIGGTAQSAIRSLIFQPRNNVPIGTSETTGFTVYVTDGTTSDTDTTASVVTTGVVPRVADSSTIRESDTTVVIV